MIQFGIALIILSILPFSDGKLAAGLLDLFAGLYLISVQRVDWHTKVKFSELLTPVDDSTQTGIFERACRAISYIALASSIAVFYARNLQP